MVEAASASRISRGRVAAIFVAALVSTAASAQSLDLQARADNTLYQTAGGTTSNGAGDHFFAGSTGLGELRRGVIAFDVSSIPAGATIVSATLTLRMSRTIAGPQTVSLHRLLASWGEAGSVASGAEGGGAPAQPGDATWLHRFFNTDSWAAPGGDFAATPSVALAVDGVGSYVFGSTSALVADVRSWVVDSTSNHGWILIGGESEATTAKRFDSRTNPNSANRPVLHVEYDVGGAPPGAVPDGGAFVAGPPLVVAKGPGDEVMLDWAPSCSAGATDYAIYEGTIGDFTSHSRVVCSTGGATSYSFVPGAGSVYFLVAPRSDTEEGSLGRDHAGNERPASANPCVPQSVVSCL